jgi:hypothetical protein
MQAANGMAGTSALATTATATVVTATAPKARPAIGRQFALRSRSEVS